MPAPTPQDARHPALEPYLKRLGAFLRARGDEDRPITIPSTAASLALSAEERRAAFAALCNPDADWSGPQAWIALGAGLHLAAADLLETLGSAPADEAAARLATLRAAAAGYSDGLRLAVSDMVVAGRSEEAKRLSGFRNKLHDVLAALRNAGVPEPAPEAAAAAPAAPAEPEPAAAPVAEPPSAEAPEAAPEVDPVLEGYLRRTAAFLRARGREDRPLSLAFGRRTLAVSAWERRIVWSALCDGRAPDRDWHRLIPRYLALQLAMLLSLDELERPGRAADAERAARLDLEAALRISAGVVEAFRAEITRAVASGAVEEAKSMSSARTAFAATLAEARRALAAEPAGSAAAPAGAGGGETSRLEELRPFLDRADHLLRVHGHEDRALSIPVGRRAWTLDVWERRVAWKVLCEESHGQPEWAHLVARGAAAQLAALLALERLRKAGDAPETRAAAEADRDRATGFLSELAERLQTTGATLAADGQERLAAQLERIRARLRESLEALGRTRG